MTRHNDYMKVYSKTYLKTKKGFIQRLYTKMKSRVTGSHQSHIQYYEGLDILPKEQFYEWMNNHKNFDELFSNWESAGYDKYLAPSVDRIDSTKGYTLGNIRLVSFIDNLRQPRPRRNL